MHIMGQGRSAGALLPQRFQHRLILGDAVLRGLHQIVQPLFQDAHPQVAAGIAIEGCPHSRHQQDHQKPGDLGAGVCVRIQQVQAHKAREYNGEYHKVGQVGIEPIESGKNQKQLEQQQKHNDADAAEHHMSKALLALLQESKAGTVLIQEALGLFLVLHFCFAVSFFTYSRSCSKLPWG